MGCSGSKPEEAGHFDSPPGPVGGGKEAGKSVGFDEPAGGGFGQKGGFARREGVSSGKTTGKMSVSFGFLESTIKLEQMVVKPKSEEDVVRLKKAVENIMLFSGMNDKQQTSLFDLMFELQVKKGDLVISQGENGDVLFVVESGTYSAYLRAKGEEAVQKYESGQLFGELALMYNTPRAATIMCDKPGRLFGLSRRSYEQIMQEGVVLKMDSRSQVLRSVELLSALSEAERDTLADLLEDAEYEAGQVLWSAGEVADCAILIKSGSVTVSEPNTGQVDAKDGSTSARLKDTTLLETGDFFGTQSLQDLTGEAPKRRVTGTAKEKVVVYKLSRDAAKKIGDLPEMIINSSPVKAKRNLEAFTALQPREIARMVKSMPKRGYARDEVIVAKNAIVGKEMYVVLEGTVAVSGGGRKESLSEGMYFLQESLTSKAVPAPYTYTSNGGVTCVVLDRMKLRELVEFSNFDFSAETAIELTDLNVMAVLGMGGFGRVKMVKHASTDAKDHYYALKCMYKGLVIAKRQTEHIMNERRLMDMCRHTFLPHLIQTFQDKTQIYVLMDLIQGGELFSLVAGKGRLNEPEAAFYCANVTCALEYLHVRNIAYRDLKPENLMIDDEGYLKVVDFGFAKVVEDRTFTVCGTPEYLAPETIRRAGHTTTVDWWAMGVLMYELITGQSPFHGGSQMDVLTRIVSGRVPYDELLSDPAWRMIIELLEVDPIKRLGSRVRGRRGVREHMFFSALKLDVDALEKRQLKPPWVPTISSPSDLRNFDDYANKDDQASEWDRYLKIYPDAFNNW